MRSDFDAGPLLVGLGGALRLVGPLVAALGGTLLLISLFLDWYEPGRVAWTVFEALDLVLAVTALGGAVVALASLAVVLATPSGAIGRLGVAGLRRPILPTLGGLAVVVVASQLLSPPPAASQGAPEIGAWLALTGAAILGLGGALATLRLPVRAARREPEGGAVESPGGWADPGTPRAAAGTSPAEARGRGRPPWAR